MDADSEREWTAIVAPYRAAAENLGFRVLDRTVYQWSTDIRPCIDFLIDDSFNFLDLGGTVVHGEPPKGVWRGFTGVTFRTWLALAPHPREIVTFGIPEPRPPVRGFFARISRDLVDPVLYRMLGEHRPLPLRGPHDLAGILASHRAKIARTGAAIYRFCDNPLDERFKLAQDEEERAEKEEYP